MHSRLVADIRACIEGFAIEMVKLVSRETVEAVQRALDGGRPGRCPRTERTTAGSTRRGSPGTLPLTLDACEAAAYQRAVHEAGGHLATAGCPDGRAMARPEDAEVAPFGRIELAPLGRPTGGSEYPKLQHPDCAKASTARRCPSAVRGHAAWSCTLREGVRSARQASPC
jgi:hypothetical protein